MNLVRKLYELQNIDSQILICRNTIAEIESHLKDNEVVYNARTELDTAKKRIAEINQQRRDLEWEIDNLEGNIKKINEKLFGGKVNNPKELVSLEQEADTFKKNLKQIEDDLLSLMNEEEITQSAVSVKSGLLTKAENEWQEKQKQLVQTRVEKEEELSQVQEERKELVAQIDSQILNLYESLRMRKGAAVAKIEQGRCQGCRLTLAVSEWQKAKSGSIVQCGSCNKILYLE